MWKSADHYRANKPFRGALESFERLEKEQREDSRAHVVKLVIFSLLLNRVADVFAVDPFWTVLPGIAVFVMILVAARDVMSTHLPESALDELSAGRKHFLFLRPFATDFKVPWLLRWHPLAYLVKRPLELDIADAFRPFGLVVALAQPDTSRAVSGAMRIKLDKLPWVPVVEQLISQALGVVVFAPVITSGFQKELEILKSAVPPRSVFLVTRMRQEDWNRLRDEWLTHFPHPLPSFRDLRPGILSRKPTYTMVTFDHNWVPRIVEAPRHRWTRRAVLLQLAAMRAVWPSTLRSSRYFTARLDSLRKGAQVVKRIYWGLGFIWLAVVVLIMIGGNWSEALEFTMLALIPVATIVVATRFMIVEPKIFEEEAARFRG